ncbi:MAG TPA: ISAs1 family transposase [Aquella sp.]|nr:ISAs1 family transposase [Aquella sp.]
MDKGLFGECFGAIKDKRIDRTKDHALLDIIALTLFAIMSGAQTFEEIEQFGELHINWLKEFLKLENGIPSHDTIGRVLGFIEPQELISSFMHWIGKIKNLALENVVAIDGKTMKGSHSASRGLKALHILSAYSCANGLSLGQLKVDGKTNEITVIPELVKQLALEGAIVTIDAMGCQKDIVKAIVEKGADYIIAVKENQKDLYETITDVFNLAKLKQYKDKMPIEVFDAEIESSHGKIEERKTMTLPLASVSHAINSDDWAGINSIVKITRKSEDKKSGAVVIEDRYFISSILHTEVQKIGTSARLHWSIENQLHWTLDVVFKEDDCRIRDENTAMNFAWFRKMALSFLKPVEPFGKKVNSIKKKMLRNWAKPESIIEYLRVAEGI